MLLQYKWTWSGHHNIIIDYTQHNTNNSNLRANLVTLNLFGV